MQWIGFSKHSRAFDWETVERSHPVVKKWSKPVWSHSQNVICPWPHLRRLCEANKLASRAARIPPQWYAFERYRVSLRSWASDKLGRQAGARISNTSLLKPDTICSIILIGAWYTVALDNCVEYSSLSIGRQKESSIRRSKEAPLEVAMILTKFANRFFRHPFGWRDWVQAYLSISTYVQNTTQNDGHEHNLMATVE